jgi:hypothetical protein
MAAPVAYSQKGIEITPFVGWQINSGIDISTLATAEIVQDNQ